jgi:hypothetical protein
MDMGRYGPMQCKAIIICYTSNAMKSQGFGQSASGNLKGYMFLDTPLLINPFTQRVTYLSG